MIAPSFATAALLLLILIGVPWASLRTHRSGSLMSVPRPGIYLSAGITQWFLFAILLLTLGATGEPLSTLGFHSRLDAGALLLWTTATLVAMLMFAALARAVRLGLGRSESPEVEHLLPRTPRERLLFVLLVSPTAGVVEEALFRGFAISRLTAATGSPALAVVLSTVAFAAGHALQGALGLARVATLGVVMAIPYLVTGSLWPGVLAHAAFDAIVGTVLARWLVSAPAQS